MHSSHCSHQEGGAGASGPTSPASGMVIALNYAALVPKEITSLSPTMNFSHITFKESSSHDLAMTTADPKAKKRNKSSYLRHVAKKPRGSRELEAGMQGLLITCNMNERKCTAEAYSLLYEYADQLYGPEKFVEESNSEDEEDDDAEAALEQEVRQINASTQKQLRRFQALDSGANNIVFIRTHDIEPDKLVHHILKDLHTTKKKKTRAILRMLPVSGSCKAFMEEIPKYFETFLEPWFKVPKKATFQIVYKARNNSHMNRDDVIKALAGETSTRTCLNFQHLQNSSCLLGLMLALYLGSTRWDLDGGLLEEVQATQKANMEVNKWQLACDRDRWRILIHGAAKNFEECWRVTIEEKRRCRKNPTIQGTTSQIFLCTRGW
ncbi:THUMP domain-containing protein 1 isoform X2 [Mobula birostris]|uniref:THUMP domain-containing protein 1 isoform X2 n=1 Tax=Mobula birostris TaxID=1983395 RepID=UPI003B287CA8